MRERTLAHLSDLHLGRGRKMFEAAASLCRSLVEAKVDHVVVTGDVTERGRQEELALFQEAFEPLLSRGRMTVVPGNHDRLGDDPASQLMEGERVRTVELDDLHLLLLDSTGPHNRSLLASHGMVTEDDLNAIDLALARAPQRSMSAVLLHHHPLPLPEELFAEKLSTWLGWPNAAELPNGIDLLQRLRSRCDLVLHGHRHVPAASTAFEADRRPLRIFNAGSSTGLGRFRLFRHAYGRLTESPQWRGLQPVGPLPRPIHPQPVPAVAG